VTAAEQRQGELLGYFSERLGQVTTPGRQQGRDGFPQFLGGHDPPPSRPRCRTGHPEFATFTWRTPPKIDQEHRQRPSPSS
jgi:hypothetical protein